MPSARARIDFDRERCHVARSARAPMPKAEIAGASKWSIVVPFAERCSVSSESAATRTASALHRPAPAKATGSLGPREERRVLGMRTVHLYRLQDLLHTAAMLCAKPDDPVHPPDVAAIEAWLLRSGKESAAGLSPRATTLPPSTLSESAFVETVARVLPGVKLDAGSVQALFSLLDTAGGGGLFRKCSCNPW
jgi:hypothetical protein